MTAPWWRLTWDLSLHVPNQAVQDEGIAFCEDLPLDRAAVESTVDLATICLFTMVPTTTT